jgi:hypothetical protein
MTNDLTPEQIVTVCLALFVLGLGVYALYGKLIEKHYTRGYTHGYKRAKWIYSEKDNGRSGRYSR